MEFSKIENLAEILNEKNLTAIEVQEGDLRIRLENNNKMFFIESDTPLKKEKSATENVEGNLKEEDKPKAEGNEVVSPLVGVVYLAPSPESDPFVTVGKRVNKGDVLCVIEAMKMLNEIAATEDGTISELCVENAAVVDYGACLFRISQE
jgi:acetyl-CoA carboxylase biotin carboxyl carrier protein